MIFSALVATTTFAQQRNVLLLIADDFGVDSHGLYNASSGAVLPPTPNIDSLKRTGVQFLNAYAQPTCSPTRATLLTGRHPFRHGVTTAVTANDGQLMAGEFTLPRAFDANRQLGYAVAHFGKWHLTVGPNIANDPANIGGWPHYAGSLNGSLVGGNGGTGTYTAWTKTVNGVTGIENGATTYATTDTTDDTLAWINSIGTNAWFAWVAFNAPHTPFHKPPNALHTYDTRVPNWATLPINTNQRLHYNAAVEALDSEIGRLLASISASVLSNTWVIFLGDNGSPVQVIQTPFSTTHAKNTLYEGGVRVPLIISGPGVVNPNRESPALVHVVDLYASILEMAGMDVSATQPQLKPIDSRSLMPYLNDQPDTARYAYCEQSGTSINTNSSGRALRYGDFKLIRFDDNTERLHQLNTDPDEQSNLLDAALSSEAQSAYHLLSTQLVTYIATANVLNMPAETQWQTIRGAEYARIYRNQALALAGTASTTWTPAGPVTGGGQALPAYAGISSIRVSANWVYVKGSALPHYTMGPWYFDAERTRIFVNLPSQWNMLARIPRCPARAATRTNTDFGPIAIWVNSAIIHNQLDAFYWDGSGDIDTGATGTEYWTRNARFAEGLTFDPAAAHQPFTGESHHHISPTALRHELGDHVTYDAATHTYSEATTPPEHSPILGWSFDGYPIYGPFGYGMTNDPNSAVRRMVSGFVPRDGNFGTSDLNTAGRTTLPAWAIRSGHGNSPVDDAVTGPGVSTNFPIGWYLQDFDYLGDLGFIQGTHFDLDVCNGRWCITPEFPTGTYAYFVSIDGSNAPAYPYIIGRQYYGVKQGGNFAAASTVGFDDLESPHVTTYAGGADAELRLEAPGVSGADIVLRWDSAEGGRYTVESSTTLSGWTPQATNINGSAFQTDHTTAGGTRDFYRVLRDSVAPYDAISTP